LTHKLNELGQIPLENEKLNDIKSKSQEAYMQEATVAHHLVLQDTTSVLERLSQEMRNVAKHKTVMQTLSYASMKSRRGEIPAAHTGTLHCLFDPGKSTFVEWLEHGNGVFWINGLVS
jgi:hypothetical protein